MKAVLRTVHCVDVSGINIAAIFLLINFDLCRVGTFVCMTTSYLLYINVNDAYQTGGRLGLLRNCNVIPKLSKKNGDCCLQFYIKQNYADA